MTDPDHATTDLATSQPQPRRTVLTAMVVAACDKTTVAHHLVSRPGWSFAEVDDFHPPGNVAVRSSGVPAHRRLVQFVHLDGTFEQLGQRVSSRIGHFMPAFMLESPLATLNPLHPTRTGVVINIDATPAQSVDRAVEALDLA